MTKKTWKIENLKTIVIQKIDELLQCESELFTIGGSGVQEESISHRLAVRLECVFRGYDVDCEYNKHLENTKSFDGPLINNCSHCRSRKTGSFRPDIVVHKRDTDKENILVIEVKMSHDCEFDKEKLKILTKPGGGFEYKLGVSIFFNQKTVKNMQFYVNGQSV